VKQIAPADFSVMIMKMELMAEIERLLLKSVVNSAPDISTSGHMTIDDINKFYKEVDANHRFVRDKISNTLVEIAGFKSERVYIPEHNDFSAKYDVSNIQGNIEASLLRNYSLLTGGVPAQYVPTHMKDIMKIFYENVYVVDTRARVKTVESIVDKHPTGKVFDLFGFQLFVNDKSLFTSFACAALAAKEISELSTVSGVAMSHKLRSVKDGRNFDDVPVMKLKNPGEKLGTGRTRMWVDFNIVISFKIEGNPICEFQIVSVQTFIVDATLKGHDAMDLESKAAAAQIMDR